VTIHFPDISAFQRGIAVSGAPAVIIKCTEGTGWLNSDFGPATGRARAAGVFPLAYHFLHSGNPAGQAAWCNGNDGQLPLMLDFEPAGSSRPGVGDAAGFIDAYRHGGGVCNLMYLPHWYWQQIGSPSLKPFTDRKMALVSSAYPGSYSDSGSGWAGYGGMTPQVWQWTDKHPFHGQAVDFNAFKGTLAQLQALATAGTPPGGGPAGDITVKMGDAGPPVPKAQARLNVHAAASPALVVDGQFGKATDTAARRFQSARKLTVDGEIGPNTWRELNKAPAAPPVQPTRPPAGGVTRPWHGEWVSAGQASLAALAANLGYPVNTLLRMTAVRYKAFEPHLAGYVAGVFAGTVKPTDNLPKGAVVWAN
jgi:Glycosyl hydrolases family 25/Putative peptidoglycan binding domain